MRKLLAISRNVLSALVLAFGLMGALSITACEDDEINGEEIGDDMEDAGEEIEDAGEEAGDEVDDAIDR